MTRTDVITKCFCALYLLGIFLANYFYIMKSEDKKQESKKNEQKSLSLTLLTAYGAIFAAVGILGSSELWAIIKRLYYFHNVFVLFGAILFAFSFFCLIVSLSITEKDMQGKTDFARNKKLIDHKLFFNRLSVILFLLASTIFVLLVIYIYI